jgi:two-component system, NarL family, response regulator DesR
MNPSRGPGPVCSAAHGPTLTVLYIEDNLSNLRLVERVLGRRTAGIPVVILSADARPGLLQRLLEQGVRGFLTKPLDVRELLEVLDGVAADREQAGRA